MKTVLKKFDTCTECLCVGLVHPDCVCAKGEHDVIELEFEVCVNCGQIVKDGEPADTPFNKEQLEDYE